MALIKPFTTPQAVDGHYHKILKVELFASTAALQVTMAIYASAEARQAGASPLWHEYITVPISALTSDPRASIYPVVEQYWDSYIKGGTPDQEVPPEPPAIALTEAATQPPPPPPEPPAPPPPSGDTP